MELTHYGFFVIWIIGVCIALPMVVYNLKVTTGNVTNGDFIFCILMSLLGSWCTVIVMLFVFLTETLPLLIRKYRFSEWLDKVIW